MDDKAFVLIEKLYNRMEERFAEMDTRMSTMESKMATKDDLARVEQNMARMEQNMARMEHKFDDKIGILFDAVQGNTEAINHLRVEMKTLETKVDDHEVKLKIVK